MPPCKSPNLFIGKHNSVRLMIPPGWGQRNKLESLVISLASNSHRSGGAVHHPGITCMLFSVNSEANILLNNFSPLVSFHFRAPSSSCTGRGERELWHLSARQNCMWRMCFSHPYYLPTLILFKTVSIEKFSDAWRKTTA